MKEMVLSLLQQSCLLLLLINCLKRLILDCSIEFDQVGFHIDTCFWLADASDSLKALIGDKHHFENPWQYPLRVNSMEQFIGEMELAKSWRT